MVPSIDESMIDPFQIPYNPVFDEGVAGILTLRYASSSAGPKLGPLAGTPCGPPRDPFGVRALKGPPLPQTWGRNMALARGCQGHCQA